MFINYLKNIFQLSLPSDCVVAHTFLVEKQFVIKTDHSTVKSFLNFSLHWSFLLVVKYAMPMCKNAINTIYLIRLSQFSPPKINENFGQLPSRFLPGGAVNNICNTSC